MHDPFELDRKMKTDSPDSGKMCAVYCDEGMVHIDIADSGYYFQMTPHQALEMSSVLQRVAHVAILGGEIGGNA